MANFHCGVKKTKIPKFGGKGWEGGEESYGRNWNGVNLFKMHYRKFTINKNNAYKRDLSQNPHKKNCVGPGSVNSTERNGWWIIRVSHNPLHLTAASLLCSMGRACLSLF